MKFSKDLLAISVVYYLLNCFFFLQLLMAAGGAGLLGALGLLILWEISPLIITVIAMFNKKWFSAEYGATSKYLLLSYLIVPLLLFYLSEIL